MFLIWLVLIYIPYNETPNISIALFEFYVLSQKIIEPKGVIVSQRVSALETPHVYLPSEVRAVLLGTIGLKLGTTLSLRV